MRPGARRFPDGHPTAWRSTTSTAWHVLSLTGLNRIVPDISRTALFTNSECKATWRVIKKQQLPKKSPGLGDLMTLMACLGESNNPAKERPPGQESIWVGIRRMIDFAIAWDAFGSESQHDVEKPQAAVTAYSLAR